MQNKTEGYTPSKIYTKIFPKIENPIKEKPSIFTHADSKRLNLTQSTLM